jgi:hypothetical protein
MNYLANFFAGASVCNCIPHLVCGLKGEPFPTPFTRLRGVANSPPVVNFVWGFFNAAVGAVLVVSFPVQVGLGSDFLTLLAGALLMGIYLSLHFGKSRGIGR